MIENKNLIKRRAVSIAMVSIYVRSYKTKLMKYIYVVIRGTLLTFYGIMVIAVSKVHAKNLNAVKRDYRNWVDYLCTNCDYRDHTEPKDIYKYGCKWGTWVTFPNKIAAIEAKVGPWKPPEALFRSQDFIAMYKHPGYYWKHVLDYLSDPNYTETQKKIAIYGLENLSYEPYLSFAKSCYKLYKHQRLSEALLEMVLSFEFLRIHPLVTALRYKYEKSVIEPFLREIQSYIGDTTAVGLQIEKILSGKLAEDWNQKKASNYIDYRNRLPFSKTICDAYKDFVKYMKTWWEGCLEPYKPPYFLMIRDHPGDYYMMGVESKDIVRFLKDPTHTSMEKRLAIFAMQELWETAYSQLIESACGLYYLDHVSVHLMEDLLHYSFPNFCKYPFYILDYKAAQYTLNKFISIPTLPCGLKEMAKKIKDGTLATPEEMAYIEGYRTFCQTHFILYETILPLKDRVKKQRQAVKK